MSSTDLHNRSLPPNQSLERLVRIAALGLVLLLVGFGAYYYWDRYIHVGDMSPVELGIDHMQRAVQQNPDDPNMRLTLVQYYLEHKEYAVALEQAQQVMDAYPDNQGALFMAGMAYTELGKPLEAVQLLEKFADLRRDPENPQVDKALEAGLYYLGQNYLATSNPGQAVQSLNEALAIDPTDADALYLLGSAYASTGQHKLAIENYEKAVRFVPDFPEAYAGMTASYAALSMDAYVPYAKGMEAYSRQDYQLASQELEQAAAGLPQYAPAFLGLALTYEKLGENQKALENVQHALTLEPENVLANNTLDRLQNQPGN